VYRRLGVNEVWLARDNVYVMQDGKHVQVERSACLPDLDLVLLCSFLDRPTMTTALSARCE
jgi:hypothetical protein